MGIFKKIKPYSVSQYFIIKRKIYEFCQIDKLSKPYPDHEKLLKYVDKKNGFFVVGGGNDGYQDDPTYYLERFRSWTGIIIEPTKIKKYCRINRPRATIIDKALVSHEFSNSSLTLIDCNAMTVVKDSFDGYQEWIRAGEQTQKIVAKEIVVEVTTLDSILENYFHHHKPRPIDLVTLDLEGYELEALRGFDLVKFHPTFLLIEIHTPERKREIENFLGVNYRWLEKLNQADHLYKYVPTK